MPIASSQVMLKPMWWWLPPFLSLSHIYHFFSFLLPFLVFLVFTQLFLASCLHVAHSVTCLLPLFIPLSSLVQFLCLNTQQMLLKKEGPHPPTPLKFTVDFSPLLLYSHLPIFSFCSLFPIFFYITPLVSLLLTICCKETSTFSCTAI